MVEEQKMVEEEFSKSSIVEERVEFMVDPAACKAEKNPTQRTGYFLKPSLNLNALSPKLPKIQSFSLLSKPNVVFLSHSTPLKGWQTWVEKFQATHEPEWRKAGIFDAIKGSTYHITKVRDLIFSLVEKWCPETNTFVFPWGEATITLEDVYVLGGFSPLGVSVSGSNSCLDETVKGVENKLIELYGKLKDKNNHMTQLRWQKHLMGCGNQIEYAAFLSLWLARHVFPSKMNHLVGQKVFAIAAMICSGAKLALGPVILASIYRDLTLLKREIVGPKSSQLKLSSPLHLVQVWAWERFPSLGPVPRMIGCGEVRLARWESHVRKLLDDIDDIHMCLESARENFRWRPYGMSTENWSLPRFFVNSGMWVVVDSDEDWKLFARCLMVGELRGLDFVEGYNPHRVALQFGFDQDIPESVDISESSYTLYELGCRMNIKGLKLYLPPRLHEGDITSRYFDWWRTRLHEQEVAQVGCKRKKSNENRVNKMAKTFDTGNVGESSMEKSSHMNEGSEDEVWTTNRSMGECSSKIDVSCSRLAEPELSRGIDQEDGNMKLSEMLLKRKQGYDAVNVLCSQVASKHPNLGNEIGQVMARSPFVRPEGNLGKSEDVARVRNQEQNLIKHDMKMEKNSEYLEANVLHIGTPTEYNGTLVRVACEDNAAEALCQDQSTNHSNCQVATAASLQVMNNCVHNPSASFFLDYESRISRLERMILGTSISNTT